VSCGETQNYLGASHVLRCVVLAIAVVSAVRVAGVTVSPAAFGTLPDGRPVPAVTLTNRHGVAATVIAW